MYLYLNRDNVVMAVVSAVRPVRLTAHHCIALCDENAAEGYVDDAGVVIYAKAGGQLIPQYGDIASVVQVDDETAAAAKPKATKYEGGKVVDNTDTVPGTAAELTRRTADNAAAIEYLSMMTDVDMTGGEA